MLQQQFILNHSLNFSQRKALLTFQNTACPCPLLTPVLTWCVFSLKREAELKVWQSLAYLTLQMRKQKLLPGLWGQENPPAMKRMRNFPSSFWFKKENREKLNMRNHFPLLSKHTKRGALDEQTKLHMTYFDVSQPTKALNIFKRTLKNKHVDISIFT